MAVLCLLIWVRAPGLLSQPRFWAEEATVFYSAALQEPAMASITHIPRGTAGYFLLSATVPATLAAQLLSIERAPYATTAAALLILCATLALILWGRSKIWRSPAAKSVACAIVLFAPTATGEIWLNSTNSQIYCGLMALILVCEDFEECSRLRLLTYVALLAGCGLSGVYTIFLFPTFVYRWSWDRSREISLLTAVLALTACVQLAVFSTLVSEDALAGSKFQDVDYARRLGFLVYGQVIRPLGFDRVVRFVVETLPGARFKLLQETVRFSIPLVALSLVSLVLMSERRYHSEVNLLALAFLSLAALTAGSATHGLPVGRYAALPGFTLLLLLLAHSTGGAPSSRRKVARSLLALALSSGVIGYRSDGIFSCRAGCPEWADEVKRWRSEPEYQPQVQPVLFPASGPQWRVAMPAPGSVPDPNEANRP